MNTNNMFIKYKYQKVIDLCGSFTIFTYTNDKNRSVSYIQSIGVYFKSITNEAAKMLQEKNIIRTYKVNLFKHNRYFLVI